MILRCLHGRASRLYFASAALLDAAPRALPSAGLIRGFHGAAGDDDASSEHGRKTAGTSSSSCSFPLLIDISVASEFHMIPDARISGFKSQLHFMEFKNRHRCVFIYAWLQSDQ